MRVLLTTQPGLGHLHPMVPLARSLAAAGHEVAFACAESFRPRVEALGFATFAAGIDWLESEAGRHFPDLAESWLRPDHHLRIVREVFAGPPALRMADDLGALVHRFQPHVLVRDDFEFAAAAVAEGAGLPCVTVGIELLMPPSFWAGLVGPQIAQLRAILGLPARAIPTTMLAGDLVLALLPPSYQLLEAAQQPRVRFLRPDPPDEGDGLPPGLAGERRRRVYATAGTVFNRTPGLFEAIVDGLAGEDLDLVVSVGPGWEVAERDGLASRAGNVRVFSYLPQEPLIATCDLVITHGGVNTLLSAFRRGLPVLVIPLSAHHPLHALRVESLGLGAALQGPVALPGAASAGREALSAAGVRTAVRRLLGDPACAERCRRLAAEIAALPGPEQAVEELEALSRVPAPGRAPPVPSPGRGRSRCGR